MVRKYLIAAPLYSLTRPTTCLQGSVAPKHVQFLSLDRLASNLSYDGDVQALRFLVRRALWLRGGIVVSVHVKLKKVLGRRSIHIYAHCTMA